ncbi:hypothetical protein ACMFMG_008631 [Clarireedia jacksonii]
MAPIHHIAVITPAPGKEARLQEILIDFANAVEKQESGVLAFQLFEQYDGANGNVFVVHESYEDGAALEAHTKSDGFAAVKKAFADEGVLAKPLELKKVKAFGGFESR